MGWSCNDAASNTLQAFDDACYAQTNSSNMFETAKGKYFADISRTEHLDGAITGTIYKMMEGGKTCKKSGSFRIEGDGTVSRGPAFMKKAAKNAKPV